MKTDTNRTITDIFMYHEKIISHSRLLLLLLFLIALLFSGCAKRILTVGGSYSGNYIINRVTADTTLGKVVGEKLAGNVISFKGIPYAKAPVGILRFKPPVRPEPWTIAFPAFHYGAVALQPLDEYEPSSLLFQDEDCLSLNIWTQGIKDKKRPVMVFIHGGGFMGGGSADSWYNGEAFAQRGDVVLVSINYRVNVFGWLDLKGLGGEEYKNSGNLGLLDQISALTWIKTNIGNFGGDPDNITIFGESAGSISVTALMCAPSAKGLFQKVIGQSGTFHMLRTHEDAAKVTHEFVKSAGIKDIKELISMDTKTLLEASNTFIDEKGEFADIAFQPVIDGDLIPKHPSLYIKEGGTAGVSLLTGSNLDELRYWLFYFPLLEKTGHLLLPSFLKQKYNIDKEAFIKIKEDYMSRRPNASRSDIAFAIGNDATMRIPHIKLAEAHAKYGDTWMYLFTWPSKIKNGSMGAFHALELPFVFNCLNLPEVIEDTGPNPPQALADAVQDAWIAFARTGMPEHEKIPSWPKYESEKRATMIINKTWEVTNDPYGKDRLVWGDLIK